MSLNFWSGLIQLGRVQITASLQPAVGLAHVAGDKCQHAARPARHTALESRHDVLDCELVAPPPLGIRS
jgi:hypothetical protein